MALIELFETKDFEVELKTQKTPMPAMHYHSTYEIYYLVNGEREYFIENDFFKLTEGDIVLIPKGLLHRTAGKGASRYLIYFSEELLRKYFLDSAVDLVLKGDGPVLFHPDDTTAPYFHRIMNTLLQAYNSTEEDNMVTCIGYLYQILFMIATEPNTYIRPSVASGCISDVVKYINANYSSINGIEEIAKEFFISKYYLCRTFGKHFGITVMTYLNTIKIKAACDMIREGNSNMTEVATSCGFNSASYFCKVFKKEKGISPTEYRKLCNG